MQRITYQQPKSDTQQPFVGLLEYGYMVVMGALLLAARLLVTQPTKLIISVSDEESSSYGNASRPHSSSS